MNREAAMPVKEAVEGLAPQRRFRAYETYRDSGVAWLADVPMHWTVRAFRYSARIANGQVDPELPEYRDLPLIAPNHIESGTGTLFDTDTAAGQAAESGKYFFEPGAVLYSKIRPALAKVCVAPVRGLCSADMYPITPASDLLPSYLMYFLLSRTFTSAVVLMSDRVAMPKINRRDLGAFPVLVPPSSEQQVIAAFLDRETARLDELIAKKQRFIELLAEKRTALISHVVTKGLNPDAPMKDSGVEWLGQVPEHWSVKKLRYLCTIQTGDKDTVDAIDGGDYPFFVRSQTVERINSFTFDCEAVLTAGDGVGVGKVFHHFTGRFDVHQRVYVMDSFKNVMGRFLFYFLKEQFYRVALEGSAKSTVDSLRRHMFTDFPVVVPPMDDQARIINYLDTDTERLDGLVEKVDEAIDKLREYRSALISDAVTGKIDVRGGNQTFRPEART